MRLPQQLRLQIAVDGRITTSRHEPRRHFAIPPSEMTAHTIPTIATEPIAAN